ncbi:MAG TPA: TetR/AcrR family transcriptional regulator [Polyangiaceae bacterium]|nr:TetR/AcrR family transcriptional regulator [Polyangiaceae bacterium]
MGKPPKPRAASRRRADAEPVARREQLLETALTLVSEHGIAGASLRKLAAELGMSQPSLYHYFPSKEALVSAVVEYCADKMLAAALDLPPPQRKEDVPRFAMRAVVDLWSGERHPRFVSFMFVVALESKANRAFIQRVFEERLYPGFTALANAFGRDEAERTELRHVLWMVVYSLGLAFMEQRALFGKATVSQDVLEHAEWVVGAAERLLRSAPGQGR